MTEREVTDFLIKDGNLELALDIETKVHQLKLDMHTRFWSQIGPAIKDKLLNSEYTRTWKYQPHPAIRRLTPWGKSYFIPLETEAKQHLNIAFGQGTPNNGYRLFWGVKWNSNPEGIDQNILIPLRSELANLKVTNVEGYWINWGYTDYVIYSSNFLRKMYSDDTGLIAEVSDKIWSFFETVRPFVDIVNRKVNIQ